MITILFLATAIALSWFLPRRLGFLGIPTAWAAVIALFYFAGLADIFAGRTTFADLAARPEDLIEVLLWASIFNIVLLPVALLAAIKHQIAKK